MVYYNESFSDKPMTQKLSQLDPVCFYFIVRFNDKLISGNY